MNRAAVWLLLAAFCFICGISAMAGAPEPTGAEFITLDGGDSGAVPFPHRLHQTVLGDCMICHSVFPQKAGSIGELKASGELKQKQVMNKQCTACHRKLKKEGKKTGPTTCKSCHVKDS